MKNIILLILTKVLVCLAAYPECYQYRDESCLVLHNQSPGICKPFTECVIVVALLHFNRTRPTICSFEGYESIICCPINNDLLAMPIYRPNSPATTTQRPIAPPVFIPIAGPSGPKLKIPTSPPISITTQKPVPRISSPLKERKSLTKCKKYKICEPSFYLEAVAGVNAKVNEFPHMTAIGWPKKYGGMAWNCGGSLISEDYILTAAHCTALYRDTSLNSVKPTVARLGDWNLNSEDDNVSVQDIPIVSITIHPGYSPPSQYHDIALMKLGHAANFTNGVRPACLQQSTTFSRDSAFATGWGRLGYMEETSDILQKVVLQMANKSECQLSYKNEKSLKNGIIDEQLCAVDRYGMQDTCQGDSGGPLQIQDAEYSCSYHIIGVTSFGIGCGNQGVPGVYTRVSSYLDWIEDIVWPN